MAMRGFALGPEMQGGPALGGESSSMHRSYMCVYRLGGKEAGGDGMVVGIGNDMS